MAKKPKIELAGEPEGGSALSPLIGVAREDMIGAVVALLRETAAKPDKTLKHMQMFGGDVLKIMTGKSELAPAPKDKRFADPAWSFNPFYRAGVQYYLAVQNSTQKWIDDLEFDEMERNRARFVSAMILDALSPTNSLAGNPSAIKRAIDSGGLSLMKGLKNAYTDIVHNDAIVSQVDKRPFTVGENLAVTPGAVVWRTEMMELIQYNPTGEQVHAIPLLDRAATDQQSLYQRSVTAKIGGADAARGWPATLFDQLAQPTGRTGPLGAGKIMSMR